MHNCSNPRSETRTPRLLLWLLLGLFSCTASVTSSQGSGQGCDGSSQTGGTDAGSGAAPALVAARIRRLTNAEYDATLQALFGITPGPGQSFAPDARQNGYTHNDAQLVDPVLIAQLSKAADDTAAKVVSTQLNTVAPCPSGSVPANCAAQFIRTYGARAYRRALTQPEIDALAALYNAGETGGSYSEGITLVIRGMLQSSGFLYHTELGASAAMNSTVTLTSDEIAEELSYLLVGAPADATLAQAAAAGKLTNPDERETQARRLLANDPRARALLVRAVQEWLGIDRIGQTAKDAVIYPTFESLRPSITTEATAFVDEVIRAGTGTVSELLSADWTKADSNLASMYGVTANPSGRTSLTSTQRRGILSQAAFLSVYAHAHESSPVARGVAVMRRLSCVALPSPSQLNIMVVPPVPDPTKTTRERFAVHSTDAVCQSCHALIDGAGFTFEQFDGMGRYRTTENGRPVDPSSTVPQGLDFSGSYPGSAALAQALAQSATVRTCFTRQLYRSAMARTEAEPEQAFVDAMPAAAQGNIVETLIAFVRSPGFIQRRLGS